MKPFNVAKRYGAKVVLLTGGVFGSLSAFAQAVENPIVTLINSISLAGVAAAVAAIMLIVVAIAMTFKGGTVAKRVVRSV